MNLFHKDLAKRWVKFSLPKQLAEVGCEVYRSIRWRGRNTLVSRNALFRALELLDLTVSDPKNRKRLREILRLRELLVDYFVGENLYCSSNRGWEKYFDYFTLAATEAPVESVSGNKNHRQETQALAWQISFGGSRHRPL